MASPKAFVAIEETMAAAMHGTWAKIAQQLLEQLRPALAAGKWEEAHGLADQLHMQGVVSQARPKIEEMAISAVLFGAHHVAGAVRTTSFAKGREIPYAMQNGINQLVAMVESDGVAHIRRHLHALIRDLQLEDGTTLLSKEDMGLVGQDFGANGGLMEPDQHERKKRKIKKGPKTLYVSRRLINAQDVIDWAHTQGFKSVQMPEDMHATIAYSKEPFDWDALDPLGAQVKVQADPRGLNQFGDATVLRFQSAELEGRWREFVEAGASWDHDGFSPHITLTWAGPPRPLAEIEPYRGPLVFGPEVFKPINPDWRSEHEELELRKAEASLADRLNEAVLTGGRLAINISANLTTSRLATFGFLAEAVTTGVETYQINEILDKKTCSVCRMMHGRTFDVQREYGRVLQALSTSDPQELRSISPWPSNSKAGLTALGELSAEEMQAAGFGSPPFHPGCRGFLDLVGSVTDTVVMPVTLSPAAAEGVVTTIWSAERVENLKWARFDVTDAKVFAAVDNAFSAGDYDTAQTLLDAWKREQAFTSTQKLDPDGPNAPKKKGKRQNSASGNSQEYDDVKPEAAEVFLDAGISPSVSNDNGAPLLRN